MAVILAFILILWAWGRFESLAICTGHRNGSKIDFLFDAYFGVARYIRSGRNLEMCFQTIKVGSGLHKPYYWPLAKTLIKSQF